MIVCTIDGGVSVTYPAPFYLRYTTNGGGRILPSEIDLHIDRWVRSGVSEPVACRHVKAMAFGGCTTAEALGIIRDKDVKGTGIELNTPLPDRWFRDAWRRRPEGGPVWIDLEGARHVQIKRLTAWREAQMKEHEAASLIGHNLSTVLYGQAKDLDIHEYARRIRNGRTWQEVRAIWPNAKPT